MKKIVVFASGSGTNAENIIKYFRKSDVASVTLLLKNNKEAKSFRTCKKAFGSFIGFYKKRIEQHRFNHKNTQKGTA